MIKLPNSRRNLNVATEQLVGRGQSFIEARIIMTDAIVAQLLPDGAVKGGSSLKLRFGDSMTRFSVDLDTARQSDIETYIARLDNALALGWEGFSGVIVKRRPATPNGVPEGYIMQHYDVKLSYLGKSWITVQLEVGYNEIGDADDKEMIIPTDASKLFQALGFPPLQPVPVMALHHQIA